MDINGHPHDEFPDRIPLRDITPDKVNGLSYSRYPAQWEKEDCGSLDFSLDKRATPLLVAPKGKLSQVQKIWRYSQTMGNLLLKPQVVKTLPIHLQLESTDACNLHCTSCSRDQFIKKPKLLSERLWKKVIDEIRPTNINVSGIGEPFLHPGIFDIIAYANAAGAAVNCATNFTRVHDNHRRIVESGVDQLKISIDATDAPTYQMIRGKDYFDHILDNIAKVNHWKRKLGCEKPSLRFNFTVQAMNYTQAEDLVRLAEKSGISGIYFQYLEYVDMEDRKGMLTGGITRERLYQSLQAADKLAQEKNISTNLPIWWRDFDIFWNKMQPIEQYQPNLRPCLFPTFSTWLSADGWVRPCPIMPWTLDEGRMGNLETDSFSDIWNNKKYRELRAALKRGERPTRSCKTCVPQSLYNILYLKSRLLPKK